MNRWAFLVILLAVGCGKGKFKDTVKHFAKDDAAMNVAMETARKTVLKDFVPILKNPGPGCTGFAIKVPIKDNDQVEVMWMSNVRFDGAKFTGRLDNEPMMVKNVKMGQNYTIAANEIADWMYIEDRKLVGGYTLRVMRDQLSAKERAEFDKAMPFIVE